MYIGIDPDTKDTAVAAIDYHNKIVGIWAIKRRDKLTKEEGVVSMSVPINAFFKQVAFTNIDHIALESQEIYTGAGKYNTKNHASMLILAQVTGIILSNLIRLEIWKEDISLVRPKTWKRSVPKPIHQKRTYEAMGLLYREKNGYSIPVIDYDFLGKKQLNPGDWKHAGDALGLALWASKQVTK